MRNSRFGSQISAYHELLQAAEFLPLQTGNYAKLHREMFPEFLTELARQGIATKIEHTDRSLEDQFAQWVRDMAADGRSLIQEYMVNAHNVLSA